MEIYQKTKPVILILVIVFLLITLTSCSPVEKITDNPHESEEGVENEIANSPTQSSIVNQDELIEPETTTSPSESSIINQENTTVPEATVYTVIFSNWDNAILKTENVVLGNSATAPSSPTREGYTFTGWDKSFDKVESDIVITAVFNINSYTVAFNTDGGSSVASINQNFDTQITSPDNPIKEGYIFSGWFPALPAKMPAEDIALTAQWEVIPVKVTGIQLDRSEFNIPITESSYYNLVASLQPSDSTNRNITWASNNTSVVSVDTNGKILGKSAGTATITATSQDGNHIASCVINVNEFVFNPISGTIKGYTGTQAIIEIPETFVGVPVKTIGYEAFVNNFYISSITLPSSITRIEDNAFYNCYYLYVIKIGSDVEISDNIFDIGTNLREVYTAGGSGTYAKQNAFIWVKVDQTINATGISCNEGNIRVPVSENLYYRLGFNIQPYEVTNLGIIWTNSNTSSTYIRSYATGGRTQYIDIGGLSPGTSVVTATTADGKYYASCMVTVYEPVIDGDFIFDPGTGTIFAYTGTQDIVVIPDTIGGVSVKTIGYEAFNGNSHITSVTLPKSIERIEDYAFYWCENLLIIDISSGVKIGDYAFHYGDFFRDAYTSGSAGVYDRQVNSNNWTKRQ